MAAPLTWRNVDAPDFRGSLAGLSVAGNSFDKAFGGLSFGLDKFDAYRKDAAEGALLNNVAGISDPNAMREAIANGAAFQGIDRSLLGRQAFGALDSKVNNLLNQAVTTQALNTSTQLDPQRIIAAGLGNDAARQNIAFNGQANPLRIQGLGLANDATSAGTASTRMGTAYTQQRMNQGATEFGWQTANRDEQQAAIPFINDLRNSTNSTVGAREFLNSPDVLRQSPGVQALIHQAAGGLYKDSFGADPAMAGVPGSGGSGGFTGSIPFQETQNYVGKILNNAGDVRGLPIDQQVDKLLPHLIQAESGGNAGAVSPKGARGLTQVMPATGQDPGFGVKPMQNQSPEEQVRFGRDYLKAMLTRYDGDPEKALAAYNAGPGNVDDWQQRRAQGARLANQSNQATQQIGAAVSQSQANTILPVYAEAMQNTKMTPGEAVAKLKAGIYRDHSDGRLLDEVNRITSIAGPNGQRASPALAVAILENNAQGADWFDRNRPTILGGHGVIPNTDNIDKDVKSLLKGDTFSALQQVGNTAAIGGRLQSAEQSYNAALAQYQAIAQRPGMRDKLPDARAKLDLAQTAWQGLLQRQQEDPSLQPFPAAAPKITEGPNPFNIPIRQVSQPEPAAPAQTQVSSSPSTAIAAAVAPNPPAAPTTPNAVDTAIRQAATERQSVIQRDDQQRSVGQLAERSKVLSSATADAMELINDGIPAERAAMLAAKTDSVRRKNITADHILEALRQR